MKHFSANPVGTPPKWTLALVALGVVTAPVAQAQDREYELQPVESLAQSGTILSGYVDTSLMWAIDNPSHSGGTAPFPNTLRMPGRLYDTPEKMDGFNLNAVSLSLSSLPSEESWAAGYHIQTLYGPDAVLQNAYSFAGGPSDFAIKEAYVVLHTPPGNGFEFRLGYFASPLGYEVYDAYRNPNYSRSYGYYIEPRAHTGATVSYNLTDWFNVMGGVGNNYSPNIDARMATNDRLTYLGAVRLTGAAFDCPDLNLTLGYTGGHTATGAPTDTGPRIHNWYAGLQTPFFLEGLTLGGAFDYRQNFAAGWPAQFFLPAGPRTSFASATAVYLTYKVAKCDFNLRAEYARATPGNTIFGARSDFGSAKPMFGPDDEKFFGFTATVGYEIWKNVISRIEARWDRDCAGGVAVFGTAASPRQNSYTLGLNLIYCF